MKKVLFFLLSVSLLLACNNTGSKKQDSASVVNDRILSMSVDSFLLNPAGLVDKEVIVTGLVAHVCKHGGQKLFMIGSLPEKYQRFNTGKGIAEFPIDLEGSIIEVRGIVTRFEIEITENTVSDAEQKIEYDTSLMEQAYHKNDEYVVVAGSYIVKE